MAGLSLGAVVLLIEFLNLAVNLPQAKRQIPERVFWGRRNLAALRFGFEYGTGFRTYITSNGTYILLIGLICLPISPFQSALTGVAFGFGRSISVLQRMLRKASNWQTAVVRQSRFLARLGSCSALAALSMYVI